MAVFAIIRQQTILTGPSGPRPPRRLEQLVLGPAAWGLALLVVPAVLGGKALPAKTLAAQNTRPAQQQSAANPPVPPGRRAAAHTGDLSRQSQSAPQTMASPLPASPAPMWPANQPPNRARVSWDSRGLEIQASNSSLDQILHEVAAETGAKVEGLTKDQRIFGSYGPGPGCDVLSKLLDGADYNVLMIGSRDANAPLEIVLSARSAASEQTAQKNQNGSHSENGGGGKQLELEPQPDYASQALSPQPAQDPFNIGGAPRDPQQFMQEILQRQQSLDQQQEQQQKQDQSNHPQR